METKKIIEVDSVESLSNNDTIFVNSNNSLKQILKSNLTTNGKSAYAYAVEGGYTGTETEFAAKLAEEMPEALPNPNALTFTGAVTGSYDGSQPLTVNIPSGGGGEENYESIADITLEEEVGEITAFSGDVGYKKIICLVKVVKPTVNTATSNTFLSIYTSATGKYGPIIKLQNAMCYNADRKSLLIAQLMGELSCAIGTTTIDDTKAWPTANLAYTFKHNNNTPFKSISLWGNNSYFGVGSTIQIWGVKA